MNLLDEVDKIKKDGYSEANAEAKLCQDIIIKAISQSSLNRNVTIKGGVVMRSLSKNARRATQDLDIKQEEYCFDVCFQEDSASVLINSREQMITEKLKSLMRFGTRSTRYKDAAEIRKRAERIFNSSTYKKQVERSKKNWLDLSVDEVLKKDLEFLYRI